MKQGKMICCPSYRVTPAPFPWGEDRIYNNKALPFEDNGGIVWLKKEFNVDAFPQSAVIRAAGLGVFTMFINGKKVGNDLLSPGWTDYNVRTMELCYDILPLLQEGKNLLTVSLSNGWWSGRISFGVYGFQNLAFCGEIELTDGEKITLIPTDESFLAMVGGPIRTADLWDGEYFDARMKIPGCGDDYSWSPAEEFPYSGEISPFIGPKVRHREALDRKPISAVLWNGTVDNGSDYGKINILKKKTGACCEKMTVKAGECLLLDLGQNMVGVPEIVVEAEAGTMINGYFAELLNDSGLESRGNDGPEGSLYMKNYRSALARVTYIAAGNGEETYAPSEVFYGFRYFELSADRDFTLLAMTGQVIGSDLEETSYFTCSNEEVNRLYQNTLWGMRGNYLSIPTDCPQRDERLGWSGDTQIFCGAGSYLADIDGFMNKWLQDARDAQLSCNGAYPMVIPSVLTGDNSPFGTECKGDAAWGDAGIVIPYQLYLMYQDEKVIADHFDSMERYMDLLKQQGPEGPAPTFGDWLNYEPTDKRYISACYYYYDASLMEKYARILSKEPGDRFALRAEYYHRLQKEIKAFYCSEFLKDSLPLEKTQTAFLLALAFELVEGEEAVLFSEKVRQKLIDNDYTLSTGFVGTGVLAKTLSRYGMDDLAYSLLLQSKDPSWIYSIRQGATTIWERWNSYTKERGFGEVSMNSFNHYSYGAVVEWLMGYMAGIRPIPEYPGFEKFLLSPRPDLRETLPEGQEKITFAKAGYQSKKGMIESSWYYENGAFTYAVTVPEGTEALVEFPLVNGSEEITVNGLAFTVKELSGSIREGKLCFTLLPGSYIMQ